MTTRERALELQQNGLRGWIELLGSSSPGASVFQRGGITASIVPACPQRSICNSVTYGDADELAASLDELAAAYDAAGIAAWTVWAPEFDSEAITTLLEAGHKLDGSPMAMSLVLMGFEAADVGDLDWDNDVDPSDLGRLNDLAYGLASDSGLAPGLTAPPADPDLRLYQARVGGEPVCVLATLDHGSDLGVYFVATHTDHRRLGLASRLMSVALTEAPGRGLKTSSLQGSPMGSPVYRRLGYTDDFAVNMYERRS